MQRHALIALLLGLSLSGTVPAMAGSEAEFKSALAAAEAANKVAGALKNQWTTTARALAAAKKAAAAHDYDKAIRLAKEAEALAKASINQAKEQEEGWKATAALIQ